MSKKIGMTREELNRNSEYLALKDMAENEGVFLSIFDYDGKNKISKDGGVYIVITPNVKYMQDLQLKPEEFPRLIEKQKSYGAHRFNPCYQFFDASRITSETAFDFFMDISRAVQHEAIVINMCRELGYDVYPRVMDTYTTAEVRNLDAKRLDPSMPPEVRAISEKSYKEFIANVYHMYVDNEEDFFLRPDSQVVSMDYFAKHKIPCVYDKVNQDFLPYFEKRITEFPEFYYAIDDKPSVQLMDLSKKWKGHPHTNPFKHDTEVSIWDIAFPKDKQGVFYKILLQYNTKECKPETSIYSVGVPNDLFKFIVDQNDIWNWDSLCRSNGVRYYINQGDIAPLDADGAFNIMVAVNNADLEKVKTFMGRMLSEQFTALPVKSDRVEMNNANIDKYHEQLQANREFVEDNVDLLESNAFKAGYSDIDYRQSRG